MIKMHRLAHSAGLSHHFIHPLSEFHQKSMALKINTSWAAYYIMWRDSKVHMNDVKGIKREVLTAILSLPAVTALF